MPVLADLLPEPSIGGLDPNGFNSFGLQGLSTTNMVIYLLVCLFIIVCMWIIFKKAGRKGRESIIPFWNTFILFKIAGKKNRFWFLIIPGIARLIVSVLGYVLGIQGGTVMNAINRILGIVSLVGCILSIIMFFKLAKKFGKSAWFGLGLLFLTPIFLGILAFGEAQYHK